MLMAVVSFDRPFQSPVLVFVVVLAVVLLVPLIFRRVRIPDIIGFILAGVVIGPHGLNVIESRSIELFSTIGLLFIMFIVGLELDLNEFQRNKKKSLVFGLLTFIIPFSVGFPVCYYLLGYGLKASILISSMFSTHTLISYPIVSRLGLSRQEAVMIVVGGTLFTDVTVLFILAFITGQSSSANALWPLFLIGSVALFILFSFYAMPRIARWFFKQRLDARYSHFLFVLLTIFLLALVAELAGLELIIGAFSAGLILSRLVAHTSPLMNRLEFTGNSLFIPIFLISVGMLVDLSILMDGPTALTVAFVLTIVALFGKWLAAFLTARWLHMRSYATRLIFGLSSSHAAATIAVVLVGYNLHIIDEHVLNGTILLILITCVVSSGVTAYASRSILRHNASVADNSDEGRAQTIVTYVANPLTMERLLDFAMSIKYERRKAPIYCISIIENDQMVDQKLRTAYKTLEQSMVYASSMDERIEIRAVIDYDFIDGLTRSAKENLATDIIAGLPHAKGWLERLMISTTEKISINNHQNIFICRLLVSLQLLDKIEVYLFQFSEKEVGFHDLLERVFQLQSSMNKTVVFHCNSSAATHIDELVQKRVQRGMFFYNVVSSNELLMASEPDVHNLYLLFMSRPGGVSYSALQLSFQKKMALNPIDFNFVLCYPRTGSDVQ